MKQFRFLIRIQAKASIQEMTLMTPSQEKQEKVNGNLKNNPLEEVMTEKLISEKLISEKQVLNTRFTGEKELENPIEVSFGNENRLKSAFSQESDRRIKLILSANKVEAPFENTLTLGTRLQWESPVSLSPTSAFLGIYGIGVVRAKRLNGFLLFHPLTKTFSRLNTSLNTSRHSFNKKKGHKINKIINAYKDPRSLYAESKVFANIVTKLFLDKKIRLCVYKNISKKIRTFCYQAHRLFQGLPTKGQRTRANAGTPRHFNPFLHLRIKDETFFNKMKIIFKKRELFFNGRYDELKAYIKSLYQKELSAASDQKAKNKLARQNAIKEEKLKIKNGNNIVQNQS